MDKDRVLGMLPDPFLFSDGRRVESADDWLIRRKEIKNRVVELEFGGMPPEPEFIKVEPVHTPGAGKLNSYRIHTGTFKMPFCFVLQIYLAKTDAKQPVILTGDGCYTTCNDAVISEANKRGFAVAKFNRTEFAPDIYNSERISGIYPIYPDFHFSAISAWAWAYHRCIDALEQMKFIDTNQIAVTGHSRGGKTVLLAGATDERITYTNPNNSGAHGAGCYRYEQYETGIDYVDKRSEKLEDLFKAVPYWMGQGLKAYIGKEEKLPHDMHFLKALVAPRYLLQTEGMADIWSNPKGSYQTYLAAKEVYRFLGVENNIGAWYRPGGHNHGFEDFCALFDFIDEVRDGHKLSEVYTRNPYPNMRPIYNYFCYIIL